ncbi:hypothetical protein BT67DRAFT_427205 [Trichocladium antarcticum]|uniref:Borealin N-terminal domain-containing protein n=1 Tax=Trichocladium antarcticum TaxID=1450529 RepID=A0AAN6UF62_9PEZI|nr:hypothetical protein BT67DRAFT_427205 [Trichocladium antarcticum]
MPRVGTKRKSDPITMSSDEHLTASMSSQQIPTKGRSPQMMQESPLKKRRVGITLAQKHALIENLQLELTERARKLRANYNIHAQSLRTRIEIRVNRIPLSLRKLTMGELLQRYSTGEPQKQDGGAGSLRGPPVPAKDSVVSRPPITRGPGTTAPCSARPVKRRSHEISSGDKENVESVETPNKRIRAHTTADLARKPGHVLSPTTSNSRMAPRDRVTATPGRSGIARPVMTPGGRGAGVATNIMNNMARSTRTAPTTAATATATATTTTTSSTTTTTTTARRPTTSSSSTTTATTTTGATAARRKRAATTAASMAAAPAQPPSRPATRLARRASNISEASDASAAAAAPAPPHARRTVMGTIKKGVAAAGAGTTRKPPVVTAKAGAASGAAGTTAGGRVLRKRA